MSDLTENITRDEPSEQNYGIINYAIDLFKDPRNTLKNLHNQTWNLKQLLISTLFIVSEAFIIVSCFEYWWFEQLYLKSTIFLMIIIVVLGFITSIIAPIKYWKSMWVLLSIYLLIPAIITSIINIVFRLGYVDYIDTYLYRSILMDCLFVIIMLGVILYRALNRNVMVKLGENEKDKRENKDLRLKLMKVQQVLLFIFDLGIGFGLAELLINIKDALMFI